MSQPRRRLRQRLACRWRRSRCGGSNARQESRRRRLTPVSDVLPLATEWAWWLLRLMAFPSLTEISVTGIPVWNAQPGRHFPHSSATREALAAVARMAIVIYIGKCPGRLASGSCAADTGPAAGIRPNVMATPLHIGAGRNSEMAKRSLKQRTQEAVTPDLSKPTELASNQDDREEITRLAFQFWIERGCPIGTPEEDWFRAEAEVRSRVSQRRQTAHSA